MDDVALLLLNAEDEEDDMESDYRQRALLCTTIVGYGLLQARQIRAERRRASGSFHSLYRHNLLPDPRQSMPWQQFYSSHDEQGCWRHTELRTSTRRGTAHFGNHPITAEL
jgi:hypothetical protein